jgi:hypothetical protein
MIFWFIVKTWNHTPLSKSISISGSGEREGFVISQTGDCSRRRKLVLNFAIAYESMNKYMNKSTGTMKL